VLLKSQFGTSLEKTVIKYNFEEYFGIDVQMKVVDLEFLIVSIWLDSAIMNIFLYNLKLKIQKFLINLILNKILAFLG
jgi:hypothetical protein